MNLFTNLIILFNKIKTIYFYDKINGKFIECVNWTNAFNEIFNISY